MDFKRLSDKKKVDLLNYVADYVKKYPDTEIGISTDSINRGPTTVYATVVVLYRKGKGGHVLFKRLKEKRQLFGLKSKKDFNKLFKETVLSQQVTEMLQAYADIIEVNLDYNADPKYFSNTVLLASIGWFKGMGVKVLPKPCPYAQVADKVVRKI